MIKPRGTGKGRQPPGDKILMPSERAYHFTHFLQVSRKSLWSLSLYIFCHDLIHVYSPGEGADSPQGTKFWCQQKCLFVYLLQVSKNVFKVWFYTVFCHNIYIAPGQGQIVPRGQHFDVSRKALSLHPFVASLKKISLKKGKQKSPERATARSRSQPSCTSYFIFQCHLGNVIYKMTNGNFIQHGFPSSHYMSLIHDSNQIFLLLWCQKLEKYHTHLSLATKPVWLKQKRSMQVLNTKWYVWVPRQAWHFSCYITFPRIGNLTANTWFMIVLCFTHSVNCRKLILTHISISSHFWDIGKQCRPRSDATERGVWSGSSLFANRNIYSK